MCRSLEYTALVLAVSTAVFPVVFSSCDSEPEIPDFITTVDITDTPHYINIAGRALDTVIPTDSEGMLRWMNESDDSARYAAGIIPTMALEVPDYAWRLLHNRFDGFLIVDKASMKIYRYDRFGVPQEQMGMACSKRYGTKHKRRDNRTPEGFFTIEGKYDSSEWHFTDDDGNVSEKTGEFGPRFMRLKVPVTTQIGIHGTSSPWSIGGRRSHGCIRVTNENILRLAEIVKTGWPVIVSPGSRDMAVNQEEGVFIPAVTVLPDSYAANDSL